jgi:replicative DNA helicase
LIVCGRRTGDAPGFIYLGQSERDDQWAMYPKEGDPLLRACEPGHSSRGKINGWSVNGEAQSVAVDWQARAQALAPNLTIERRAELATALGLPEACLTAIPLLGFNEDDPFGPCWTFPEVDADGRVVGITRRRRDSRKKAMDGGHRGLTVPDGWREREGSVLLVEGPSDVLAATAMGLAAIGRPSNTGGVEHLVELLKDVPIGRDIYVVGEFDPKQNGAWPGRDGAERTAAKLSAELGRPVYWALPPDGAKDVRKWALNRKPDAASASPWQALGQELLQSLHKHRQAAPGADQDEPVGYRLSVVDSATFAARDFRPEWLVRELLVRGQPVIVGGPKKTLKTSLLIDLALSLASGQPFLGKFAIERPCRVMLLSGESGEFTLQETALRVCQAKGIELARANVLWGFDLPQLANPEHREVLKAGLQDAGVEVLLFDPLYLALLAGQGAAGLRAENIFDMGPLLRGVARTCLSVSVTPVLVHHARKNFGHEPLELDGLAYSGFAEFARQWLLVSRRERYIPGTGYHQLWLSVGGSAGQSGLWAVNINEGTINKDFGGRRWDVSVTTAEEVEQVARDQRNDARRQAQDEQDRADEDALLEALDRLDPDGQGAGYNRVQNEAKLSDARMWRAVDRLAGQVNEVRVRVVTANSARREVRGLQRVRDDAG